MKNIRLVIKAMLDSELWLDSLAAYVLVVLFFLLCSFTAVCTHGIIPIVPLVAFSFVRFFKFLRRDKNG